MKKSGKVGFVGTWEIRPRNGSAVSAEVMITK